MRRSELRAGKPLNLSLVVRLLLCALLSVTVMAQQDPVLPAQTQNIQLPLIVVDAKNNLASTISTTDLIATSDGQPLRILAVEKDSRKVVYAVAVDASGSFRQFLPASLQIARAVVSNGGTNEEAAIISFVDSARIERLQEFTSDKAKLASALGAFRVYAGQTAVLDALYVTLEYVARYRADDPNVRRVVLLFTDGEDRNSFYKLEKVTKLIRQTSVQVFVVAIVNELDKEGGIIRMSPRQRAEKLVTEIADESGGRAFFPRTNAELISAAHQINSLLAEQEIIKLAYVLKENDKGYRPIKIQITSRSDGKKLKAITPSGFWVGSKEPLTEGRKP